MHRRQFLQHAASPLASVALASLLANESYGETTDAKPGPHFKPRAKNVIWMFMIGGASHMESFDPKPALNKFAGKTIAETPHADVLKSPFLENERITFPDANGQIRQEVFPLQTPFRKWGESGLEISDWFPHVGKQADDLCLIRSMWTEDSNHGAQLQFHTGRHRIDGFFPTIGSWISYGLGSLNQDLPEFVVLGSPLADCCGGKEAHRANYLGPKYDGTQLVIDENNPLPFARPTQGVYSQEQAAEFAMIGELNGMTADRFPDDEQLKARIQAYELAYRMQTAVPDVVRLSDETKATRTAYGLDAGPTKTFGEQCLTARRLVERGVRFVQLYHGNNGGAGGWDSHKSLKANHSKRCKETDQPIGALIADLKQRGLLDETLVVWATEFGRTPGSQSGNGRDHHPYGFSVWMAGGGIKGGVAHGATDELGFHAVENRHYVTDVHATVLHQLGLDARRLVVPGRKRLEKDFGKPIREIMA